jgi:hypothetical protein
MVPLLLTLQIILSKVAGLAHAGGIVGPISVFTLKGHPALALAVIALVAHVLGVMLLLKVVAHEVGGGFDLRGLLAEHILQMPLLKVANLLLSEATVGMWVVRTHFRILGSLWRRLSGLHLGEKFALHLEEVHDLSLAVDLELLQLVELGLGLVDLLLQSKKCNGLILDFFGTGRVAPPNSEHGTKTVGELLLLKAVLHRRLD